MTSLISSFVVIGEILSCVPSGKVLDGANTFTITFLYLPCPEISSSFNTSHIWVNSSTSSSFSNSSSTISSLSTAQSLNSFFETSFNNQVSDHAKLFHVLLKFSCSSHSSLLIIHSSLLSSSHQIFSLSTISLSPSSILSPSSTDSLSLSISLSSCSSFEFHSFTTSFSSRFSSKPSSEISSESSFEFSFESSLESEIPSVLAFSIVSFSVLIDSSLTISFSEKFSAVT